jgi:hypothetical protein
MRRRGVTGANSNGEEFSTSVACILALLARTCRKQEHIKGSKSSQALPRSKICWTLPTTSSALLEYVRGSSGPGLAPCELCASRQYPWTSSMRG